MLQQVELASTFFNKFFQLAITNFVGWQCLRSVVIRATTLFNLQCNNVALQIAAIFCSYYFTLNIFSKNVQCMGPMSEKWLSLVFLPVGIH